MATLHINEERCKGCGFCVLSCPKQALSLSKNPNTAGYYYAVSDDEKCIKCGICYTVCPDIVFTITEE
ncbi:MAG: 4Fe-4S binding protein [Firmicutes bacterium]|nr:4Fe-4S binding protein [Bacillota bacterium]